MELRAVCLSPWAQRRRRRETHTLKKIRKIYGKNWQLWLPEFYRKKYGNNILGFTVLT